MVPCPCKAYRRSLGSHRRPPTLSHGFAAKQFFYDSRNYVTLSKAEELDARRAANVTTPCSSRPTTRRTPGCESVSPVDNWEKTRHVGPPRSVVGREEGPCEVVAVLGRKPTPEGGEMRTGASCRSPPPTLSIPTSRSAPESMSKISSGLIQRERRGRDAGHTSLEDQKPVP